ncbi:MAG: hypothetical protein JWP94_680 [Mucilaginibacter sp.]|nr:hypothetical protein [Mucilaginibacter sp.]
MLKKLVFVILLSIIVSYLIYVNNNFFDSLVYTLLLIPLNHLNL